MLDEGPPLDGLLRRLLETPPDFLAEPLIGRTGQVDVAAVVWDVFRAQALDGFPHTELAPFRPKGASAKRQMPSGKGLGIQVILVAIFARHSGRCIAD